MEELLSLAVRSEDVDDLVHIELLHLVAGGAAVLAGIELTRLLNEDLADGSSHCETGVGVDVDLAYSAL